MDKAYTFVQRHSAILLAIALAFATLFPIWVAWLKHDAYLNEDSYITLTYAKNLARGDGFIYNHQPATLGTTSPLLALCVGGLAWMMPFLDIQTIAVFFTAACWAAIPWLFFLFRRSFSLEDWQAAVIGLVLIASGWVSSLGMEAYLFAFLLTLSIALFFRGNLFLAGMSTGFLFLARGEGCLLLIVFLIYGVAHTMKTEDFKFRDSLRLSFRLLAGFSIVLLVWITYALITFGNFLPGTLAAKRHQGQWLGISSTFFHALFTDWFPNFGWQNNFAGRPHLKITWVLVFLGLGYIIARRRKLAIFPVWIVLYVAGYSLLGVAAYPWYKLPVYFVLQLLAALGLIAIMVLVSRLFRQQWLKLALPVCITTLYLFFVGSSVVNIDMNHLDDWRGLSYQSACVWLNENSDPSTSVAYLEVGYLGYYSENRIIDLSGLVTPDITNHLREGDADWAYQQYDPDHLIIQASIDGIWNFYPPYPAIVNHYRLAATIPGPGENNLLIYKKRT